MVHRRTATDAFGNWKPSTELREDPEVDLWRRAHLAGYRVGFVPRLTAVKFPASWRRDAYRTRACHEQAAWFRRIQEDPDLEAAELGRFLEAAEHRSARRGSPLLAFPSFTLLVGPEERGEDRCEPSVQGPGTQVDAMTRRGVIPPSRT